MIQKLSGHELLLYHELLVKDKENTRLTTRSYVEYAMAFLKPEVLQKILKDRELEQTEAQNNKEIFEKQVADMFGKPLQSSG